MSIIDLLFGSKKTYNHPIIGALRSQRIKGQNLTRNYTWYGNVVLNGKSQETTIILEGDSYRPYTIHLDFISQLIQNWSTFYLPKIENKFKEIEILKIKKYFNWKNDFYLSAIYPLSDKSSDFELILEPFDKYKTNSIAIEVKNDIVAKVVIHD